MKKLALTLVLALSMTGISSGATSASGTAKASPKPPAGYTGQWCTTPSGCSYTKAQAPGYAPTWHLILNPHHIGGKQAQRSCPTML